MNFDPVPRTERIVAEKMKEKGYVYIAIFKDLTLVPVFAKTTLGMVDVLNYVNQPITHPLTFVGTIDQALTHGLL